MKPNNCGVYKIINIFTGDFYVGGSINLDGRFRAHRRELTYNTHANYKLQNSWNTYGFNNFIFTVIYYCAKDEVLMKEQFYLDLLKPDLNISLDANAPMTGRTHSEKTKELFKNRSNGMLNKNHTEESKKLMSERRKEAAKNMSELAKAEWISKLKGRSAFWKGKSLPQYVRDKIKKARKSIDPKIGCSNGNIYESQLSAAKSLGIKQGHISEMISGTRPHVNGYKFWKIKNENS